MIWFKINNQQPSISDCFVSSASLKRDFQIGNFTFYYEPKSLTQLSMIINGAVNFDRVSVHLPHLFNSDFPARTQDATFHLNGAPKRIMFEDVLSSKAFINQIFNLIHSDIIGIELNEQGEIKKYFVRAIPSQNSIPFLIELNGHRHELSWKSSNDFYTVQSFDSWQSLQIQ